MKLIVLDPGHFHAALLQKKMYPAIAPAAQVYAPAPGPDLEDYTRRVEAFNARVEAPTAWVLERHVGASFLDDLAHERDGVVVISGNNRRKTEYLTHSVQAGLHTLADKPMAIDTAGFEALQRAFALARERNVLLYDIMTERHEITTILQREFSTLEPVFGTLAKGSVDEPAISKESVHHFSKLVAGLPIVRPAWFFDTAQQGEGLVDITTHLVDLVQWAAFPGMALDYRRDVDVLRARRWATVITPQQFQQVTKLASWPEFLRKDVAADGNLHVFANGSVDYALRGVHAHVSVLWHFEAAPGAADSHYSVMRGTRARLVIRQGVAERHVPTLYIEPNEGIDQAAWERAAMAALPALQTKYPGIGIATQASGLVVEVPMSYHVGHEAHFGQVADAFLDYVAAGALPEWEVPNMLAKYYTTTRALDLARRG